MAKVSLNSITTGYSVNPPRLLVYGFEGIGKSTFAAGFPRPIFIPPEDGLDNIYCARFPYMLGYEGVIEALDTLQTQKHEYRTVVIDTLDALERVIWKKVCQKLNVQNIEDAGYGKGYTLALTYWQQVIDRLTTLRLNRKMIVVLTAHATVETFKEPGMTEVTRIAPRLNKKANAIVCENVDAILHATRRGGSAKGKDGGARILKLEPSQTLAAKCRYNTLSSELPMDATEVLNAIYEHQRQLTNPQPQEIRPQ